MTTHRTTFTPRQQLAALAVQQFRDRQGRGPTWREVGAALGIDKVSAVSRLAPVIRAGAVRSAGGETGGLAVLDRRALPKSHRTRYALLGEVS